MTAHELARALLEMPDDVVKYFGGDPWYKEVCNVMRDTEDDVIILE